MMMNRELQTIAIRYGCLYLPENRESKVLAEGTATFVDRLREIGFAVSEELLHALNTCPTAELKAIYGVLTELLGLENNWTPLVRGWLVPTGETWVDHLLARLFGGQGGTRMPCGHTIPDGTFPLERYNGCPCCGEPFQTGHPVYSGQGSTLRLLGRWTDADMERLLQNLLTSSVPPDATQRDTLKTLLRCFPLPEVTIGMKETLVLVVDGLVEAGKGREAGALFRSPADILRYLWFKKTGAAQVSEPLAVVRRAVRLENPGRSEVPGDSIRDRVTQSLRLKYPRPYGRMVARWLNGLSLPVAVMAGQMHPKREMWVRFIRALRLPEHSRENGMEKLKELLDVFYHQQYTVWAGAVNRYRLEGNETEAFRLLEEQPGLYARSLLANMLWWGPSATLSSFRRVADQVPARLLVALVGHAGDYFNPVAVRYVRPPRGRGAVVGPNRLLGRYTPAQLEAMKTGVRRLCLDVFQGRYRKDTSPGIRVFVHEQLFDIPLPVGDRSERLQTLGGMPTGTRLPVAGNSVRLFMQWGTGMPAQHLDMDLSAAIVYERHTDVCAYFHLNTIGAKHSGDIQHIPDAVGTAEYIELDLPALRQAGARYVAFACNAFSGGALSEGMVVGWMSSEHPMQVSNDSGVAYDPSCVQQQIRITESLSKGLVFGLLDVDNSLIIWLEQPFEGRTVQSLSTRHVQALLQKLTSKLTIGELLYLRMEARGQVWVDDPALADEEYGLAWAADTTAVTKLLIDG